MTELGAISYTDAELKEADEWCKRTIDFLKPLPKKMKFLVVKTLFETFPSKRLFEKG